MIKLRKLLNKDIPFILEWMKNPEVNQFFKFDPDTICEKSIKSFVEDSFCDSYRHYAVTNENDEYQGTVSLKNIDMSNKSAEFAISMRKSSQGKGFAKIGTYLIMQIAFTELNLHRIYLNVFEDNMRARAFYEKFGFIYEGCFKDHLCINGKYRSLSWYRILSNEFIKQD